MNRRAYAQRNDVICAECGARLAEIRIWIGKMRRAHLAAGWVKGADGIWTMTQRGRERLMEGRTSKFRRYAGSGPGNVEGHFILNPIRMKCWSCGLVQTVDPPEQATERYTRFDNLAD